MRESPYPMISIEDALASILSHVAPLPPEQTSLADGLGRVLVQRVLAAQALPPFAASVVDGFALRAVDGHERRRLAGQQMAGYIGDLQVESGVAVRITTGAPMPAGADAVVQVEHADEADGWVQPHQERPIHAGMGIRPVGDDIQAGAEVLAAGTELGPPELGILASLGHPNVLVHRRPTVGVFSTGDELVEPGDPLQPGQIWDSNRRTLLAAVDRAGGIPLDLGIIADASGALETEVARGLTVADVLVTSGGVSMGELDLLKPLLEEWGTVHFGRVRIKPGKPLTFATLRARDREGRLVPGGPQRPVFALPGNPVSSLVTFQLFVRPAIRRLLGHRQVSLPQLTVTLDHPFKLDPERPEYHRVTLRRVGDRFLASSTGSQASSRLLSATGAHALLALEQAEGVLPAGTQRPALLLDDAWL